MASLLKLSRVCCLYRDHFVPRARMITSFPSAITLVQQKFGSGDLEPLEKMRTARVGGIAEIQELEVKEDGVYASFVKRGERALDFINRDRKSFMYFFGNLSPHTVGGAPGRLNLTCPPDVRVITPRFLKLMQKSVDVLVSLEAAGVDIDFGPDDINVVEFGAGFWPIIYPTGVRLCSPMTSLQQGLRLDYLARLLEAWRFIIAALGLHQHLGHELDDLIIKCRCWPATWKYIEDMFSHYFFLTGLARQNYKQRASSLALAGNATRLNIARDSLRDCGVVNFGSSGFLDWHPDFTLSKKEAAYRTYNNCKELRNYEEMTIIGRAELILQQLKPYFEEHADYSNMRDAVDKLKSMRNSDSDLYLHREKLIIKIKFLMHQLMKMDEAESAK